MRAEGLRQATFLVATYDMLHSYSVIHDEPMIVGKVRYAVYSSTRYCLTPGKSRFSKTEWLMSSLESGELRAES